MVGVFNATSLCKIRTPYCVTTTYGITETHCCGDVPAAIADILIDILKMIGYIILAMVIVICVVGCCCAGCVVAASCFGVAICTGCCTMCARNSNADTTATTPLMASPVAYDGIAVVDVVPVAATEVTVVGIVAEVVAEDSVMKN